MSIWGAPTQDKTGYMATEIGAKQGNNPTQDILAPKLFHSINYSSENSHILRCPSYVLRKLRNKFDNRQLLLTLPQIAPHNLWLQIVLHPKRLRGGWATSLKSQRQRSKLLLPSTALHAKKVQILSAFRSSDVVDDDDCNPVCKLCAA